MPEAGECGGKVRIFYDALTGGVPRTMGSDIIDAQYFNPVAQESPPKASTKDPEVCRKLWEWLEEQVNDL